MAEIALDDQGYPILLDTTIPVRSGNPHRQLGGRFGRGADGKEKPARAQRPPAADPEEWARRMDAVREAAREFESFSGQDVTDWLKGRTNRQLSEGEIDDFLADVRAQQLADIVDILDQNERGVGRGRRTVKVSAPKGYTRKTLNGLTDSELQSVARRLVARGWTAKQIKSGFINRLPVAKRAIVSAQEEE